LGDLASIVKSSDITRVVPGQLEEGLVRALGSVD
jgi:hypothetical protein